MKAFNFSIASVVLSTVVIIGLIVLNYQLATIYLAASGKTKALFGITELTRIHFKLYFVPVALAALVLSIVAFKRKGFKWFNIVTLLWCTLACCLFFVRFWRLML